MSNWVAITLDPARKALLVFAGIPAFAAPVIIGVTSSPFARAQSSASTTQAPRSVTPTFDAASVKPMTLPGGGMFIGDKVVVRKADGSGFSVVANTGGPGTADPARIHYPFITLKDLLGRAFDSFVEIRGPGWLDNDLIQVDATMPLGTTRDEFKEMLRNLIADRFKLQYHVETKGDIVGYALVLARNGPKMKESPAVSAAAQGSAAPEASSGKRQIGPDGFPVVVNSHPGESGDAIQSIPGNRHKVIAWQLTMEEFARDLAHVFKIRVVDATGLNAKYDFTMFFGAGPNDTNPPLGQPPAGAAAAASASDSQDSPDFFEALQWQLGLRLEARKMPAQVMVIDHVERAPTGN